MKYILNNQLKQNLELLRQICFTCFPEDQARIYVQVGLATCLNDLKKG